MPNLFAVLPILPSLVGLISLLPAIVASMMSLWFGRREKSRASSSKRGPRRGRWLRFWFRQIPSLLVWFTIFYVSRWAWLRMDRPSVLAQQPGVLHSSDWSMPRRNVRRTGAADSTPLPVHKVAIHWRFAPPGTAFYGDPLPYGDSLIAIGSRESSATIYCLNQATGEVRWTCRPRNYRATVSSPVVHQGVLYVGEGLHYTRNARIIAVSLTGSNTGQVLWTYQVAGHIECTPSIHNNRLYFAAGDDGVYCLQLDDDHREPTLAWHVDGHQLPDVDTSLTLDQGDVLVGLGTRGNALVTLDAETGAERHRWNAPAPVRALPAFNSNGRIAFAAGDGDYVHLDAKQGFVLLRSRSGSPNNAAKHSSPNDLTLPGIVLGSLATSGDYFVALCSDGHVYRFTDTGEQLADLDLEGPAAGSLISTPSLIVGHNRNGTVFGIAPAAWKVAWKIQVGPPGYYVGSTVAAKGRIFLGTDHGVVCIGGVSGDSP